MPSRSLFAGRSVLVAVLLVLAATGIDAGPGGKALSAWDTAAVERARAGAAARLQDAECLKLLTDFTDRDGRTLQTNLEPFAMSASDFLRSIAFLDGSRIRNCRRETVQLATAPGRPSVYVCPIGYAFGSRFAQVQIEKPTLAEYMVIHEMLHALGLGENPPTSFEITERVRKRCH